MADETDVETVEVSIAVDGSEPETIVLPDGLLELFAEEGDTPAQVLADVAVLAFAQQIHGAVHHTHGEASPEVRELEAATLDLFEERYGMSFAEATGHAH